MGHGGFNMQAATGEQVSARATSLIPLETLAATIKASMAAGDKALDKAEQHYKSAGMHLLEAKKRLPIEQPGKKFTAYIVGECRMSTSRAYELISIAEGRTTLEEIRAKANERKIKHRAKPKDDLPFRNGKPAVAASDEDDDSDEAFATKHFMFMLDGVLDAASEAIECIEHVSLSEESAKNLQKSTEEIITAWNRVKSKINQRRMKRTDPDDDDDPTADSDHKQGLRVIAARGFLNRAKEAKEICTIEKLQASDVTEAMIKAADDAGAVWTATARNLRRMKSGGSYSEPAEDDSEDDGGNSPTEQWERSLSNMAGDAISIRAFWNKTFGKEWENFEVPSAVVTLAKQAAKEWTELAADLTKRRSPAKLKAAEIREQDRKACVALDLKAKDAERELAQWLLDHPSLKHADYARTGGASRVTAA
jgi:hypothetical protein